VLYLPIQWFGVLNHFWINYSDHSYKEDLISSHLAQICFDKKLNMSSIHDILMNASQIFTKLIIHNFIKKRSTNTYTGRCENMWLILKRNSKYQCHIWTSCRWRFAHFWFGARINHYQYHLIWEPGCHRTSFISNSQRSSQYHGLFFIKFSKIQWSFHQTSKILNSLIWYFDFWKFMDEGNF
jgi:hypothetical protein